MSEAWTPTATRSRQVAVAERALAAADPVLAELIAFAGPCPIRPQPGGREELFASLCRSIVFQQLAGKAASTIHGRFVEAVERVEPESVLGASPEALRAAGLSGNKAASIRDLAERVHAGLVDLEHVATLPDDELVEQLSAVRGIGRWTAEMFLMFQLGRLDVWPTGDLGVRKGFAKAWDIAVPTPKELGPLADRFRPHRSVVAWYCWRAEERAR